MEAQSEFQRVSQDEKKMEKLEDYVSSYSPKTAKFSALGDRHFNFALLNSILCYTCGRAG